MSFLTETQRRSVFENVIRLIDTRFMGADADTSKLRQEHETTVVTSDTPEAFEHAIDGLLRALGTSHTGMFHESRPRSAGRIAMAATLTKAETSDGQRWVFQDVHPGGVAAAASISPGDVLLAIVRSPAATTFSWPAGWTELVETGADASDDVESVAWRLADGTEGASITVDAPGSTAGVNELATLGAQSGKDTPPVIAFSDEVKAHEKVLRDFLMAHMYRHPHVAAEAKLRVRLQRDQRTRNKIDVRVEDGVAELIGRADRAAARAAQDLVSGDDVDRVHDRVEVTARR